MSEPQPWMSVEHVAGCLGISKDTVYCWIEARNLPMREIGRPWASQISDIDDWVRAEGASDEPASAESA